jgi:hypothetical protein
MCVGVALGVSACAGSSSDQTASSTSSEPSTTATTEAPTTTTKPTELQAGCRLILTTIARADEDADVVNNRIDLTVVAHPFNAADVWNARNQSDLEAGLAHLKIAASADPALAPVASTLASVADVTDPGLGTDRFLMTAAIEQARDACTGKDH